MYAQSQGDACAEGECGRCGGDRMAEGTALCGGTGGCPATNYAHVWQDTVNGSLSSGEKQACAQAQQCGSQAQCGVVCETTTCTNDYVPPPSGCVTRSCTGDLDCADLGATCDTLTGCCDLPDPPSLCIFGTASCSGSDSSSCSGGSAGVPPCSQRVLQSSAPFRQRRRRQRLQPRRVRFSAPMR